MSESQRKSGIWFWYRVAAALAIPMYPLSLGPFQWAVGRYCDGELPPRWIVFISHVYDPLIWLLKLGPRHQFHQWYADYLNWWMH